ncbi:MAG: ECF-type sigma factor [Pseudomonadota bacterium]|nr:ECF-type sigma factor [Pseudomonadota bacterium]
MTSDPAPVSPRITELLKLVSSGDRSALGEVYSQLYTELKRSARARLYQQGRGDSLGTTTLLHESFLRLLKTQDLRLEDRRHFFAYAARAMRNIIIDSARGQLAERRGGGAVHETLGGDAALAVSSTASEELIAVGHALSKMETVDSELAETVEMIYFGGYTESEVAELQGVSERTVRRRWQKARVWLFTALGGSDSIGQR